MKKWCLNLKSSDSMLEKERQCNRNRGRKGLAQKNTVDPTILYLYEQEKVPKEFLHHQTPI